MEDSSQQQRPHAEYSGLFNLRDSDAIASSAVSIQVGHMAAYGATTAILKLMQRPISGKIDAALTRAVFDQGTPRTYSSYLLM